MLDTISTTYSTATLEEVQERMNNAKRLKVPPMNRRVKSASEISGSSSNAATPKPVSSQRDLTNEQEILQIRLNKLKQQKEKATQGQQQTKVCRV